MKVVMFLFSLLVTAIFLFNQVEWLGYIQAGEWSILRKNMGENIFGVLFITFGLMVIQNFFTIVPFFILTLLNIWLFGFIYGYFWSLIGNILGSLIVFYLSRYCFQSWGQRFNDLTLKKQIDDKGFTTLLIARIIPVLPSSVVNIVSGVSNVKQRSFIVSTIIGHTIFIFIISSFALGFITIDFTYIAAIVILFFIILALIKRLKKRNSSKEECYN